GEPYVKHQTRFDIHRDGITGRYGIEIDGTITEEVAFSAAVNEPTLYVASSVTQLDDSFAVTSRLSEFNALSGTIVADDTTSFAGIDLEASAIKELTKDVDDEELSDELKAARDKIRADALAAVNAANGITETDDEEDDDEDASSITNVDSDFVVNADTSPSRVAVDSEGGIYVVGQSAGSFSHQINTASTQDVFLTKFDTEGNVVFSRLLGVDDNASVHGITVDADDNVIIVGQTNSALSTGDVVNSEEGDLFVTKISKRGDEIFRYQLDTFAESGAHSVAVDSAGDIFVGGYTKSGISATSGFGGGSDALILKLDGTTGALTDSNVFGASGNEVIKGIAVDANDNLVVATEVGDNAVVYRIDGTSLSTQTASVDFGTLGITGSISSIAIDNVNNDVYIAGVTTNTNLNAAGTATVVGSALGGQEGFVSGLSLTGATDLTAEFTTYLSTDGTDSIGDVTVQNQVVYVAGSTNGTLSGEVKKGTADGFVARVNGGTGALENVEQYGESLARTDVAGVAFTTKGNSVLETLGLPQGTVNADETRDVETQTSAREGDFFYISIDGGTKKKITLDEGDTYDDIVRKLRISAIGKIDADVASSSEGDKIKISTVDDGVSIDLLPGTGDRDLLKRIGLSAGKLLPRDEVLGIKDDDEKKNQTAEDTLGGIFGLKLEGALHIKDKTTAKYVLGLLDTAITTIQRADRSLKFNPFKFLSGQNSANQGSVPPHLTAQLANFQSGLARLQSGSSSSSLNLFI
ncbi:MAG: SBBP repeat-containing protein, partial [Kordiimonadaceae bacterium]|nr:SBBP repeat-containing protein [Kordiimonadaceae bacterium]